MSQDCLHFVLAVNYLSISQKNIGKLGKLVAMIVRSVGHV